MAVKIKILASQWRNGNVTQNGTEIELTDEQVAEIAGERIEELENGNANLRGKLHEIQTQFDETESVNRKLVAEIEELNSDIGVRKIREAELKYAIENKRAEATKLHDKLHEYKQKLKLAKAGDLNKLRSELKQVSAANDYHKAKYAPVEVSEADGTNISEFKNEGADVANYAAWLFKDNRTQTEITQLIKAWLFGHAIKEKKYVIPLFKYVTGSVSYLRHDNGGFALQTFKFGVELPRSVYFDKDEVENVVATKYRSFAVEVEDE